MHAAWLGPKIGNRLGRLRHLTTSNLRRKRCFGQRNRTFAEWQEVARVVVQEQDDEATVDATKPNRVEQQGEQAVN
jgi:hypothetical protein